MGPRIIKSNMGDLRGFSIYGVIGLQNINGEKRSRFTTFPELQIPDPDGLCRQAVRCTCPYGESSRIDRILDALKTALVQGLAFKGATQIDELTRTRIGLESYGYPYHIAQSHCLVRNGHRRYCRPNLTISRSFRPDRTRQIQQNNTQRQSPQKGTDYKWPNSHRFLNFFRSSPLHRS